MTDTLTVGGGSSDFAVKVALAAEGGSAFADRINMLRQAEEAATKAKQELGIAGDAAKAFDEATAKIAEAKEKVAKAKSEAETILREAKVAAQEVTDRASAVLADAEATSRAANAEAKSVVAEANKSAKAAKAEADAILKDAKLEMAEVERKIAAADLVAAEALEEKLGAQKAAATLENATRDFLAILRNLTNG